VHDFVALEGQGVVTAYIASSEFTSAGAAQAEALGYPEVPSVFVPHPIQDRTDDEMRALAEQALAEVLRTVTASGRVASANP
jgi:hypothetical protein